MQREKEEAMKRELAAKQEREKQLAREQEEVGSLVIYVCMKDVYRSSATEAAGRSIQGGSSTGINACT